MSSPNAGLLFNKTSFEKLHLYDPDDKPKIALINQHVKKINKQLYSLEHDASLSQILDIRTEINGITQFELLTSWPGLTLGGGYGHATGKSDEEFKIGFYFDHTTGMPVIPGSYIKGKLRSFFPGRYSDSDKKKLVVKRLIKIFKHLNILVEGIDENSQDEVYAQAILKIERFIFDGKAIDGKRISQINQDIFLEAFIKNGTNGTIVEGNKPVQKTNIYLAEDTITPHKHPLKNPVPLRFLKILPGVKFCFQFKLHGNGGISSGDKEKLFHYLLSEFGIGAKTTSGYGKFQKEFEEIKDDGYITFAKFKKLDREISFDEDEDENDESTENKSSEIAKTATSIQEESPIYDPDWKEPNEIQKGSPISGTVDTSANGNIKVKLHVKNVSIIASLNGTEKKGDILNFKVTEIEGKVERGNFNIKVRKA